MLAKGAAVAASAFLVIRGKPQEQRNLGASEIPGQGYLDSNWSLRENDASALELTKEPVRITSRGLARAAELSLKQSSSADNDVEEVDVVVCGGAAAGLSAAACLQHEGLSVIVIEKNESVGDIWRSRYHRLNLHDIIQECHLPFFPMPSNFPTYATRNQFATYLDAYHKVMGIDVRTLHVVDHASKSPDGSWLIRVRNVVEERKHEGKQQQTSKKFIRCQHFVLANGIYNDPVIPNMKNGSLFKGLQLHSSRYTNASDLKLVGKKVLVVGWGNSGCEISVDLCEHGALPTIVVRSRQVLIPRFTMKIFQTFIHSHLKPLVKIPFGWAFLLPIAIISEYLFQIVSRLYFGRVSKLGFKFGPFWLGPFLHFILNGDPPVMDVGTVQCAKEGKLKVTNKTIMDLTENGVLYQDGTSEEFHAIVWATGYQMLQGHKHIFDSDIAEKIGLKGKNTIREKKLQPGKQHPNVKNLWNIWGRLQMINDAAPQMARMILTKTPNRQDLHPRSFFQTWKWVIIKHFLVLILYIKYWRSKSILKPNYL